MKESQGPGKEGEVAPDEDQGPAQGEDLDGMEQGEGLVSALRMADTGGHAREQTDLRTHVLPLLHKHAP